MHLVMVITKFMFCATILEMCNFIIEHKTKIVPHYNFNNKAKCFNFITFFVFCVGVILTELNECINLE